MKRVSAHYEPTLPPLLRAAVIDAIQDAALEYCHGLPLRSAAEEATRCIEDAVKQHARRYRTRSDNADVMVLEVAS